ncbi:MAG: phosphomethylpyrimidine synthase ThiC [Verrucomicrobiota bacterium]|jgi:hypothetical protein
MQVEIAPVLRLEQKSECGAADRDFGLNLLEAWHAEGFGVLRDHGVDEQLVINSIESFQMLCSLNDKLKQDITRPDICYMRGLFATQPNNPVHSSDNGIVFCRQEAWHTGRAANRFPEIPLEFGSFQLRLFQLFERLGLFVLNSVAEAVGDRKYLRSLVYNECGKPCGHHVLRFIHYPHLPDSLNGNATRSGTIIDRPGKAQLKELEIMGELVVRARAAGVKVRVEAPIGHVALEDIPEIVASARHLCKNAPIGALGPLPTDVGLGYDDISSAIGAAVAVAHGLDFVSAISRREHIGIPALNDTVDGVIAARIAAHAGDLTRLGRRTEFWDRAMSTARSKLCWEGQIESSVNPERARKLFEERNNSCVLCGKYCPLRLEIPATLPSVADG